MKIKPVVEGDMFFNADKTHFGTVVEVKETVVSFIWKNLHGKVTHDVKISKRQYYKYRKENWKDITPLEKELL